MDHFKQKASVSKKVLLAQLYYDFNSKYFRVVNNGKKKEYQYDVEYLRIDG